MNPINHPLLVVIVTMVGLALSARVGVNLRRRRTEGEIDFSEYGLVESAALTLLGLIIGFTFSMAIGRFDQRKQCEAKEANTIGTEYLRAGLLPPAEAAKVRGLLVDYLDQRVLYYGTRWQEDIDRINGKTATLQAQMWSTVETVAGASPPNPVVAVAVMGMNDVIDAQGYTQAAWLNRIPMTAWVLMVAIAIFANALLGYTSKSVGRERTLLMVMPMILAVAFFLIADIDSPRWGLVRVVPDNLESLALSLHAPAKP